MTDSDTDGIATHRESTPAKGNPADGPDRASGDPAVHADGVAHSFGDVSVLDGVTLAVPRGAVTAVVGPNGSGKTTLLRVLGGLLAPTSGTVDRWEAATGAGTEAAEDADTPAPVETDPEAGTRQVGYLPQAPAFRPAFTVRETVAYYADLLDTDAGVDVDAAIERVGMAEAADRRVDALSGGMVRLLGIAVAVLGEPPLVLLDEPTGDLDPTMTDHVFEVVADLADEGMGVCLATHDLTGAAAADRVAVLADGGLAADGSPEQLLAGRDLDSLRDLFRAVVDEHREGDGATVSAGGAGS